MELKLIWDILFRRKWVIILTFMVLVPTSIVGTFMLPPVYESDSKVLLKKSDSEIYLLSNIGLDDTRQPSSASLGENDIENCMTLATSEPILDELIWKLQLIDKKGALMTPSKILEAPFIISAISPEPYVEVNAIEDTDMIEFTSKSSNPDEADMIVNAIAEILIEKNLKSKKEEFKIAEKHILKQIESMKAQNLELVNQLVSYKKEQNIVDLDIEVKEAVDQFGQLMDTKKDTVIKISETQAKIDKLKKQLKMEDEYSISGDTLKGNSYIQKLKAGIIDLKLERTKMLTEKNKEHPDVKILNNQLEKLNKELKNEIILNKSFSSELQSLERDMAGLKANQKTLDSQIKKYLEGFYAMPGKKLGGDQLELDYKVNQGLYTKLLQYLYQVRVVGAVVGSDIKLVESATSKIGKEKSSPSLALNGIIAVFLSTLFGFGLAFLVEYVDDTIKTPEQVKNQGVQLFGTIPKLKRKDNQLISELSPKDPVNESYRIARNGIKFAYGLDTPFKSLLVSSPEPGEGKTTVSANLAISMAQERKNILLIDLDLRKPFLHNLLDEGSCSVFSREI